MTCLTERWASVLSTLQTTSLRVSLWERPALWVQNSAKAHKQVCASVRTDGRSVHQRTGALVVLKFVSFILSLLFIHIWHLAWLSDGSFLYAVSVVRLKQKRRRARPAPSESEEVGADCAAPWRSIPILLACTLAANSKPCSKIFGG